MRPLADITVVTLEHAIAAPFATRQLADLGARVIKVERPKTGDFARAYDGRVRGMSSHFMWVNRSKESLTLDLKNERANQLLRKLILEEADVVVQNLAPGAAARLGISYEELSKERPDLIVCDISGYGDSGPYRDKKAYDLLIQSEAGFVSVTGTKDEPVKAGSSIADIAAGMYAYTNILAALLEREKTGKGQRLEISMLESLVEWMGFPLYYSFEGASQPPRAGAGHATIFPYGPFVAGDGKTVMLGLQNEREWASFCEHVLQSPELANSELYHSNSKRHENREQLTQIITGVFAGMTRDEVIARLEKAQIANAQVNNMAEVWDHPQLKARNRWRNVQSPIGEFPALLPPGGWAVSEPRMDAVPAVGEHSKSILEALGCSVTEIESLASVGAI
ncbi:L-carnitine dehydratase/bile acid-inducible protein F [Pseudomonas chlororaphis]|uniref:L-carnitine dehydratase/bile acid-inducible protein F n=1 Tax=Pseudomonas chlororaphis TaxID=587753 RepID=A0A3G7TJI3_9PSED|nr:CaiB/BaiF CoA-transferase family protein [Pseudomonas chlororaphis]AZE47233.1 L-carnitine dehydratase/bile acid-inducible protein F [Pseudomonas chlororaphis]